MKKFCNLVVILFLLCITATYAQEDCVGMDMANVAHTETGDILSLRWTAIEGDNVEIAIWDPSEEMYKSLGTAKMSDEKFDYKLRWDGEQNFTLTNGCKLFNIKFDAKRGNIGIIDYKQDAIHQVCKGMDAANITYNVKGDVAKGRRTEIVLSTGYSKELNDAFEFAYLNGITTIRNIKDEKFDRPLTRIDMARMLSNYAINVLCKEPDISKGIPKFKDVSDKLNKQYDNAVTLAYQLGIMGQNMGNDKFRPNDEVTRAEFATALSRLLYGTQNGKGSTKYYEPHITKLLNEGILNNKDSIMKEKRGYAMLMLMRSALKK